MREGKRQELSEEIRENELEDLFKLTMGKKWKQVVQIYEKHPIAHLTKLTKSNETALHIAISSYRSKTSSDSFYIDQMIDLTEKQDSITDVLWMQNVRGDTPLHLAAAVGSAAICERIASKEPEAMFVRNANGETPLFIAAHHGNVQAFLCLHELYCATKVHEAGLHEPLRRTKDGNTVLHSAISGEYFALAYQIICYYPKLVESVNVDGESPLHVLARKPNVFQSSGHLHYYDCIIYYCVFVDELRQEKYDSRATQDRCSSQHKYLPQNYRTCGDIFLILWRLILIITGGYGSDNKKTGSLHDEENQHHRENKHERKSLRTQENSDRAFVARAENCSATDERRNSSRGDLYPANCITCIHLFKFAMKIFLTILGVGFGRIKKIKSKKERHCHAVEIMNKMIGHGSSYKYDNNGQRPDKKHRPKLSGGIDIPDLPPLDDELGTTPSTVTQIKHPNKSEEKTPEAEGILKKESPLIVAAKMGILEMVKKIIRTCPVAIQDLDSNGKNVLMLAAEYRQTIVFDYLLQINLPEYMFHQLDVQGNNILHLAAKLGEAQPWRIPGAALQMQWEIKWYKYVKGSVSSLSLTHHNINGETPRMVLTKTHKKLMKAGNEWLIKTSESCSVVAALIATVAFATSATVPGGLDQLKGFPILKDHTAFDVFSIASLVALCLSITALVFFLAIITSRCEERDFKRNLPRKLLMGLTCLFSSIAGMLLSFCAGHTFILREKLKLAAVPIYAFATVPVAFFAMAQLPLYFDLLWAACRKVPLRSYKVFYQ